MTSSRIPAEKSVTFAAWDIPEVKKGQVIQTEKLRQRGPRGELLGLDKEEVVYSSITAGQLEEITQSAYEDVREQAYREGLRQGHDEGYQAGLKLAESEISRQLQSLQNIVAESMRFLADQDDHVEQALVNLAVEVASALLRRELTIDSSQVLEVVQEAVRALPANAGNITIKLSEQDYQQLNGCEEIEAHWRLQVDPALAPGGCLIVTDQGVVDFTMEQQFQQLVRNMVDQRFASLSGGINLSDDGEG